MNASLESPATAGRGRRLAPLGLALVLLALAACLAALGHLPVAWLPWTAGPAVLATAALPLLVRWSPPEPSPWKLAVLSLALSPPLAAAIWAAWHVRLDAGDAMAACAASVAVGHLFLLGRRVRCEPFGRGQWILLSLSVLSLAVAAAGLLRGSQARLLEPALTRAGVASAIERSLPPSHAWLAGEPWPAVWNGDLLAAFTMNALRTAPTQAHALLAVLAAGLVPWLLALLAASAWNDSRRNLFSVALALSAGAFAAASGSALGAFWIAGPSAYALALSLAGMACASHALRHGRSPWVAWCGLFHGAAMLVELPSAWPAAAATFLAALAPTCTAAARPKLLLALVLGTLPALALSRTLAPAALPEAARWSPAELASAIPWLVLSAAGAAWAWRGLEAPRRAVLVLCGAGALVGGIAALFPLSSTDPRSALTLALFLGAIPAAGLYDATKRLQSARSRWAMLACALLACACLWQSGRELAGRLALARHDDPLLGETARALEPIGEEVSARDLRAALAFLRADPRLRADRAVLVACPVGNPYRQTRDLPDQALAACAGLPLYGDTRSPAMTGEPEFLPRLEELLRLFRNPSEYDPTLVARLVGQGARAVVVLVRDEDRAANAGLGGRLERMGCLPWREFGGVALYLGPLAATPRYLGPP